MAPLFVLIAYRYLQERRIFLPVTWLIPSILSTHLASGCVYFPLAFLCSSVPNWSPRGRAMEFTNHIRENARWHWERTPAGADALDWLSYHLQHVHASFPAFLLVATFIMLVGTAIRMGLIQSNRIKAVFGMTVFALLFATTVAPALRYHTGWIVTVPALGFGIFVLRYKAGFSPLVRYYIPVVTITLLGILGWRHPFVMAQHYRLLKDGQLSQAAFLEAASAFDQQDYIKAYRVYDWACRINTGHPEACSDRKIVLDRLSPEQKVELRNLETNRIGIRIDFPTIEPWYWLFPGPAQSFDSLLHFRTLDWHGTQILVTEDASLVRCSSQPAPCFSDDAYKTVAPMNPERGVRGGVTVSDRPWVH